MLPTRYCTKMLQIANGSHCSHEVSGMVENAVTYGPVRSVL